MLLWGKKKRKRAEYKIKKHIFLSTKYFFNNKKEIRVCYFEQIWSREKGCSFCRESSVAWNKIVYSKNCVNQMKRKKNLLVTAFNKIKISSWKISMPSLFFFRFILFGILMNPPKSTPRLHKNIWFFLNGNNLRPYYTVIVHANSKL